MSNYDDKSTMAPINVLDEKLDLLANTFGCSTGSLPFTYLALPLSLTNPCVVYFWPLVSRCECRLMSTSNFLSQAGRLELTNVVFTTMSTFTMCTFWLPKTIIKQIDNFQKHCL